VISGASRTWCSAGGSEELDWNVVEMFDAMGRDVLEVQRTPEKALARLRRRRDGFRDRRRRRCVGAEKLEHAKARGAKIYAEVAGYGATRTATIWWLPQGRVDALHEAGAVDRASAGRLHQSARHLDADRRHQGDRGNPRGVRRQVPDDLGDRNR
jgi:3-oxoacyl-(acyl-carrier-protein) synthase